MKTSFYILMIFLMFWVKTKLHAEELILPKPTGPYSVGTKALELHDPTRLMLRDSTLRKWMVQAFYPAQSHTNIYSYMPGTLTNGMIKGIRILAHAKPDDEFLKGKWPVIIFTPGLGEGRQNYTILCEELASHGYVVFSLDQPYVTNFIRFLDGSRLVLTFKDVWKVPRDRDYRYQYYDAAMAEAIKDIQFMLDHFGEMNGNFFSNQLEPTSIILIGHSFGGNVAHTLGFSDSRIKAVIDIDSKITERKIFGRIGVPPNPQGKPVLFIRGMMQYQEDVGDQLTKITNATIWSPQVQHSAFRDMAYITHFEPTIGHDGFISQLWNWFWKLGPHFDAVDTNLGKYKVDQWFQEYRLKIVTWLKDYH